VAREKEWCAILTVLNGQATGKQIEVEFMNLAGSVS
jgi:hypothetical protein